MKSNGAPFWIVVNLLKGYPCVDNIGVLDNVQFQSSNQAKE